MSNQSVIASLPLFSVSDEAGDIIEQIRSFSMSDRQTESFDDEGIPYLVNEFWTARQRQAHSLHEVSYRACFKAQLPEFFISRLTRIGEAVHDPFMGRGTTPVQAALMGRAPYGGDVNPLSVLLARPRLQPPRISEVAAVLRDLQLDSNDDGPEELLAFYHPTTLQQLMALRSWLLTQAPLDRSAPDPVVDWIRMVAINRLTGHSSGFFSGRSMPPNQAVSVRAQQKINHKHGISPPARDVKAIILKKTRTLLSDGAMPPHPAGRLFTSEASHAPLIENGSVSLVVTSPPFLDIVQYAGDNWLRCWFAGIDVQSVRIAMHKDEAGWTSMVRDVLIEQARILRPGGHVAFEVGEVRRGKVLLERLVWKAASDLPFDRLGVVVNDQDFTKTANCWGVSNNSGGTNTNRIVLLRRH